VNCRNCQDLFSLFLENDLSEDLYLQLDTHLDQCGACYTSFEHLKSARMILIDHAPKGRRVGLDFTQKVMRQIRTTQKGLPSIQRTLGWRNWAALAAAALLIAVGLRAVLPKLPLIPGPSTSGFRVIRALTHLEEPYSPGAPLDPGDIVVAERGGRIPLGGRILGVGPGGIVWVPPAKPSVPADQSQDHLVFAFSDEHSVQVLSGSSGIAWRATPTHRRRYLHELIDLAEGQDVQVTLMAKEELGRLLGVSNSAIGTTSGWRMALAEAERLDRDQQSYVMFPVVERSAQALGGPAQDVHLSTVSRAIGKAVTLVSDRYLPAPLARLFGGVSMEGS